MTRRRLVRPVAVGVQLGLQLGLPAVGAAAATVPVPDPYPPRLTGSATAAPNPAGWYRSPVPVRWTATDGGSGLAAAVPDGTVAGEGTSLVAAATAFDRAGNHRSEVSRPAVKIDLTPPVTTLEAAPGWAAVDRSLTLAATDNLSGVAVTRFRVDGGVLQDGDLVALTEPGRHAVEYWSVDRAGNQEVPRTAVLVLDRQAPTVTHRLHPAANPAGWHRSPVTVTFRCRPGAAPVADCPAPLRLSAEAAGAGRPVVAVDRGGGRTVDPVAVNIDRTDPVIAVRADHTPTSSGWYGEPVTLTFSCWDALSGIPAGGCPAPVTVSDGAGRPVRAIAADLAGNRSGLTVEGIDVDASPPVTLPRVEPAERGQAARVRLPASDRLSGVAGTYYRLDGGPTRRYRGPVLVTGVGEHALTYWSVDRAGNVEGGATGLRRVVRVDPG